MCDGLQSAQEQKNVVDTIRSSSFVMSKSTSIFRVRVGATVAIVAAAFVVVLVYQATVRVFFFATFSLDVFFFVRDSIFIYLWRERDIVLIHFTQKENLVFSKAYGI